LASALGVVLAGFSGFSFAFANNGLNKWGEITPEQKGAISEKEAVQFQTGGIQSF
jgi:hypothetical protein